MYAASRVPNASPVHTPSAFRRCWIHGANKTSELLRSVRGSRFRLGIRRAYSTTRNGTQSASSGDTTSFPPGTGIPLYRMYYYLISSHPASLMSLQAD